MSNLHLELPYLPVARITVSQLQKLPIQDLIEAAKTGTYDEERWGRSHAQQAVIRQCHRRKRKLLADVDSDSDFLE